MKRKTFVVKDPLNDDFAGNNINTKPTPPDYVYIPRAIAFRAVGAALYYGVAKPVTWLFCKVVYHHKFVNKGALKSVRGGCFFFGNHTLEAGDAFIPNHMRARKNFIVTSPDATSIPGIRTLVKMFGALPVASCVSGTKNFKSAVGEHIEKGRSVTIYPEAHIWPKYTGVRPFKDDSFALPADIGAPCFSFTNVYLKSKNPLVRRPVVKTYIDGPFFPDEALPKRARARDLRDRVYEAMAYEASKQEQYVTNVYIKEK